MSDFTCPYCEAQFDNEGDPYGDGDEAVETCPECDKEFMATCYISVDYECEALEDVAAWEDKVRDTMKEHDALLEERKK